MAKSLLKVDNVLNFIDEYITKTFIVPKKSLFGTTNDGDNVYLYVLKNCKGMEVEIINYGGIIRALRVPNNCGDIIDVTIGLDTLDDYINKNRFFGTITGRYANRIANGEFTLNGIKYKLPTGPYDMNNCLHGGRIGFDKKIYDVKNVSDDSSFGIELSAVSADGEEGFPGKMDITVTYLIGKYSNELRILYKATTSKDTVINLTNHAYWNLDGKYEENGIYRTHVKIYSDYITAVNDKCIPNGQLMNVVNTPFNFNKFKLISKDINADDEQIKFGSGYDHNFVLKGYNDKKPNKMLPCAVASSENSGVVMKVYTTEPGVQFYTGNYLDGQQTGKGNVYKRRSAFCLETQHFPDSPNHSQFPSTKLGKNDTFQSCTVYAFSLL